MKSTLKLSDRDQEILFFMWRWKMATTRNIWSRFYGSQSFRSAYVRLWRMENAGLIESISTPDRQNHFWTLTQDSYKEIIAPVTPGICQQGFKSEYFMHDFMVNALQLGDFICQDMNELRLFTEQQLRRLDPEFYPGWVPKSKLHRPDGYSFLKVGEQNRILAYEVELSQKKLLVYENVGRFYELDTKVDEVVWLVDGISQAKSIQRAIQEAVRDKAKIHSFILVDEFRKHHWQTQIALGKSQGLSVREIHGNQQENRVKDVSCSQFFDTRKSLVNSIKSQKLHTEEVVNR